MLAETLSLHIHLYLYQLSEPIWQNLTPQSKNHKTNMGVVVFSISGTEIYNESLIWVLSFNQQEWKESLFTFSLLPFSPSWDKN